MNSLNSLLRRINKAISRPTDWEEVEKYMIKLHTKLAEPKWAIEDENLREECEKLVVSIATHIYLANTSKAENQ